MIQLTSRERELLTRMLVSHAYREKLAAIRFEEALALIPGGETQNYWLQVIEEEKEHYQGCIQVADELDIDLEALVEARMHRQPPGIPPFSNWLDVLLAHALNDKAGYYVLLGLIDSKIESYAALACHIVSEEESHGACGAAALVGYFSSQETSERHKRDALGRHIDAAIRCLGRPGTQGDREAVQLGLKTKPANETIVEFCSYVKSVVNQLPCHDQFSMLSIGSIGGSEERRVCS